MNKSFIRLYRSQSIETFKNLTALCSACSHEHEKGVVAEVSDMVCI